MRYFFPFGEVNASFLNLLTRANNYRKFLSDFFSKKVTWHCSLACRNVLKIAGAGLVLRPTTVHCALFPAF